MKIVKGYQNTNDNKEDLAITPYLFSVFVNGKNVKVFGFGICWIHYSYYIALQIK